MARRRGAGSARSRIGLGDVARLAGVSPITVSRALRQPEKVAPPTRQRVAEAIDATGYVPDLVASSLATNQSRIVAIIVPTIAASIFEDSVQGLSDTLSAAGYQLIIADSGYSKTRESELITALLGRRPDALVLTGIDHAEETRRLLSNSEIPIVEIWDQTASPLDSTVGFSNEAAGFAITAHLIESGYQRIGYFGNREEGRGYRRWTGYRRCLEAHNLGPPVNASLPLQASLVEAGRRFEAMIDNNPSLDAVFCNSDPIAMGALFACQKRGWAVPNRIAIAGFGDFDIASAAVPALTTVRIPRYELGRRAAQLILEQLANENTEPVHLDLGFEIVQRDSS